MGLRSGALGLILLLASAFAYIIEDDNTPTIVWPTEYSFKGEVLDVVTGEIQTYETWYSQEHNRSRIEYFGGTNKHYYVAETEEETGYQYVIYPVTDKNLYTEMVCEQQSHIGEQKNFMPDVEEFEYSGVVKLDGKDVQVWKTEKEYEDLKAEANLFVTRTEYDFDIPVRKTVKVYETSKGSIDSYLITNYDGFGFTISLEDVDVNNEEQCIYSSPFGKNLKNDMKFLNPHVPGDVELAFHSFKRHHKKIYDKNEHEYRKEIFHKNWRYVESQNRKNLGYKLELNHFADYTDDEFSMQTGTRPSDPNAMGSIPFPHTEEELKQLEDKLPEEYDLRLEGYLRPVGNQGGCGSCWSFSTTATVEGALSKSNGGRNLDLSEQSLVDCAWGYENFGCSGGQLDKAYEYILQNQIPTQREYGGYLELEGMCHLDNMTETFGIRGFSKVTPGNPTAMKTVLNKYGPVAVAVYAGTNMKLYSSGILYDFDCDSAENPNHGVVVVGYGERDGTPYWIIRNSWGENWGEDGYILISAVNNNCMVLSTAFYPIV
ncbi:unnamed protein product [Diatraea saccharalis]|uniref:Uncharacterized protein n=1 Tax=Diatraea saccharalis TaxID=40085 RepID=A0A9P0G2D7_9NEOP|nr:unnamed protein product [Diatraea saccharalis]